MKSKPLRTVNKAALSLMIAIFSILFACKKNSEPLKFEQNFFRGLELSKNSKKPIFLHFTCFGCMGNNEFMDDLTASATIRNKLNEEFITIQLYVDDPRKIEAKDTLNLHKLKTSDAVKGRLTKAKTVGNLNAVIQMEFFRSNNQPLYVIMDSNRNILIEPFGYLGSDKTIFLKKLEEGLEIKHRD